MMIFSKIQKYKERKFYFSHNLYKIVTMQDISTPFLHSPFNKCNYPSFVARVLLISFYMCNKFEYCKKYSGHTFNNHGRPLNHSNQSPVVII